MHPDNNKSPIAKRTSSRPPSASERHTVTPKIHEKSIPTPAKKSDSRITTVKKADAISLKSVSEYRNPKKCHAPVVLVCIVMLLLIIANLLLKTETFTKQNPYIALVVIQFFVFILPCAFVSLLGGGKSSIGLAQYKLRPFSPRFLGFIFSSIAVLLLGNMVIKYLGYILFGIVNTSTVVYEHDNMFALIAATVLVPAVVEEILFRGVVYTEYIKKGVGTLGAIFGSSVLFAFIHFDINNFVSYLFAGIILSITVHITRSLLAPIIVHLFNNSICLFTDNFLKRVSKESISSFFVFFLFTVLLLLALFTFFESLEWICNSRANKKTGDTISNSENENIRLMPDNTKLSSILTSVFLTPAFIAVLILYFIKIIVLR